MTDPLRPPTTVDALPRGVRCVRPGPGANCSSIGSVIDVLFVAGALGGAALVAITAALAPRAEPAPEAPPAPSEEGDG